MGQIPIISFVQIILNKLASQFLRLGQNESQAEIVRGGMLWVGWCFEDHEWETWIRYPSRDPEEPKQNGKGEERNSGHGSISPTSFSAWACLFLDDLKETLVCLLFFSF